MEEALTTAKGQLRLELDKLVELIRKGLKYLWGARLRPGHFHHGSGVWIWLIRFAALLAWPSALVLLAVLMLCTLVNAFFWWWDTLKAEPLRAVLILLVLLAFGAVGAAAVLRVVRPETTMIISSFELTTTPPGALPITGKTAADLLKDEVQQILEKSRYYVALGPQDHPRDEPAIEQKGQDSARSVEIGPEAAVSAVGIEVEGLSFEKILALYDSIRQDQKRIEGDVVFTASSGQDGAKLRLTSLVERGDLCRITLRARMPGVGHWVTPAQNCDEAGLQRAAHRLAELILESLSPNTLATYLINDGRSKEALLILRKVAAKNPRNVQSVLDLAGALNQTGDKAGAITEYREALKLSPKYPEQVHIKLGLALKDNFQAEEAKAEYKEAIGLQGKYAAPHDHLAALLFDQADLDGAQQECKKALEIDEKDAGAKDVCGRVLDKFGKFDEAIAAFREAVEAQPEQPLFHLDLAIEVEKNSNFDAAITEYREYTRLSPDDAYGHTDLGLALAENGELEEAMQEQQKALSLNPDFADAHNSLGLLYKQKGNYEDAIREFNEATHLPSGSYFAWTNLAIVYGMLGDELKAEENFKKSIDVTTSDVDSAQAATFYGDALRDSRKFEDAIGLYKYAIERIQKKPSGVVTLASAYIGMGYAYDELGDEQKAMESFQYARSKHDSSEAHVGIGIVLENVGRTATAIREYRIATQKSPDDPGPHRYLASALAWVGEYDSATRERSNAAAGYDLAARRNPSDAGASQDLGNMGADYGDYKSALKLMDQALQQRQDAVTLFQKSVRATPSIASTHNDRGAVLESLNQKEGAVEGWSGQDEAIKEYRLAVELSPNYRLAHTNLADALEMEGNHQEAIDQYRQILNMVPHDVSAHTSLGFIYDDLGKYAAAIAQHQQAIELSKAFAGYEGKDWDFPEARRNLCRALKHRGDNQAAIADYDAAITECKSSLRTAPLDPETHLNLADALVAKRDHCVHCWKYWLSWQSEKEYKLAVTECQSEQTYREDAYYFYVMGLALEGLGQTEDAINAFENALWLKPIFPKADHHLAQALVKVGKTEDANYYFTAAKRDPLFGP
jgi:tetratricopeptide (TPR) repeat protein